MTDKVVHELALAYAQTVLAETLRNDPSRRGTDEVIRDYLKDYHFAVSRIPEEDQDIDLSTMH